MSKSRRSFAIINETEPNPHADESGGPIKGKEIEFFDLEVKRLTPLQIEQSEIRKKNKNS